MGLLKSFFHLEQNNSVCQIAFEVAFYSAMLLLVPLLATLLSQEFSWNLFDFLVAWALLFGAGLAYKLATRHQKDYRLAFGTAVAAALILIWMNLAVGLIGNEEHPANLLYFGVVLIGIVGSLLSGFRPQGMMVTMFAMAIAQFLVPFIALFIWRPDFTGDGTLSGMIRIFIINTLFSFIFLISANLFRKTLAR